MPGCGPPTPRAGPASPCSSSSNVRTPYKRTKRAAPSILAPWNLRLLDARRSSQHHRARVCPKNHAGIAASSVGVELVWRDDAQPDPPLQQDCASDRGLHGRRLAAGCTAYAPARGIGIALWQAWQWGAAAAAAAAAATSNRRAILRVDCPAQICARSISEMELTAGAWPGAATGSPRPAARPCPGPACTQNMPHSLLRSGSAQHWPA